MVVGFAEFVAVDFAASFVGRLAGSVEVAAGSAWTSGATEPLAAASCEIAAGIAASVGSVAVSAAGSAAHVAAAVESAVAVAASTAPDIGSSVGAKHRSLTRPSSVSLLYYIDYYQNLKSPMSVLSVLRQ